MAIAERELRARFGADVQDHHTFAIAGDGCLQEGISHEAASLAGHLGLGHLVVVYDDNHITIDGDTVLSSSDDAGGALPGLRLARDGARRDRQRLRRARGRGPGGDGGRGPALVPPPAQPHRLPVPRPHGRSRGPRAGLRRRRRPPDQGRHGHPRRAVLGAAPSSSTPTAPTPRRGGPRRDRPGRSAWPSGRATGTRGTRRWAGTGEPGWQDGLPTFEAGTKLATRQAIQKALAASYDSVPGLVAGAADLTGNTGVKLDGAERQSPEHPGGRQLYFGIREHAMGASLVGMACHGGVVPVGGTFFVFSDYLKPTLAAGRHERGARRLRLQPRLGRRRRGRPHAPAHRAAGRRCGPSPASRSSGRRTPTRPSRRGGSRSTTTVPPR